MKLYDFGVSLLLAGIIGYIGYSLLTKDCTEVSTNPSVYECVEPQEAN